MSLLHWATPVLICRIACRWTLKWATGMAVSVPGGSIPFSGSTMQARATLTVPDRAAALPESGWLHDEG